MRSAFEAWAKSNASWMDLTPDDDDENDWDADEDDK